MIRLGAISFEKGFSYCHVVGSKVSVYCILEESIGKVDCSGGLLDKMGGYRYSNTNNTNETNKHLGVIFLL
jgi:hypothetical protein